MRTSLLLLPVVFPVLLGAQEWEPIPTSELTPDLTALKLNLNAAILFKSLAIDDQKKTVEEHVRIKVLTEEGRNRANIEIPFIKGSMEIAEIHARTVSPDGKSAIPFDGVIYETTLVRVGKLQYLAKTLTMPAVQAGSILEYRYVIRRKDIGEAVWELQSELYTLRARFAISPAKMDAVGYYGPPVLRWNPINVNQAIRPEPSSDGGATLEITNVPALESEEYSLPGRERSPRFEFYYLPRAVGVTTFWSKTFESWAQSAESFIGQPKDLRAALASIVDPSDTEESKLRKIYARVQHVRNLTYEGIGTQESRREDIKENKTAADVWKRGYGASQDIDFLFVALARTAGLDADLVRYVGRDRGFVHRDLPDATQFTGILAVVSRKKPDGAVEQTFLDPAVPTLPYGMIEWDCTGVAAVRLHGTSGDWININNRHEWGGTILRKAQFDLDASGKLSGKVTVSFAGQDALWRRKEAKAQNFDEMRKREDLEATMRAWLDESAQVKLLNMTGWEDSGESLTAQFSVDIQNFAASTAKRLLAPAAVFRTKRALHDATQHASRTTPFYFSYSWEEDDDIEIHLPPGFEIEEVAAPSRKEMPLARFEAAASKQADILRSRRLLSFDGILYNNIKNVRDFFSDVRAADDSLTVILKARKTQ